MLRVSDIAGVVGKSSCWAPLRLNIIFHAVSSNAKSSSNPKPTASPYARSKNLGCRLASSLAALSWYTSPGNIDRRLAWRDARTTLSVTNRNPGTTVICERIMQILDAVIVVDDLRMLLGAANRVVGLENDVPLLQVRYKGPLRPEELLAEGVRLLSGDEAHADLEVLRGAKDASLSARAGSTDTGFDEILRPRHGVQVEVFELVYVTLPASNGTFRPFSCRCRSQRMDFRIHVHRGNIPSRARGLVGHVVFGRDLLHRFR
jgi:hypothetical protein